MENNMNMSLKWKYLFGLYSLALASEEQRNRKEHGKEYSGEPRREEPISTRAAATDLIHTLVLFPCTRSDSRLLGFSIYGTMARISHC